MTRRRTDRIMCAPNWDTESVFFRRQWWLCWRRQSSVHNKLSIYSQLVGGLERSFSNRRRAKRMEAVNESGAVNMAIDKALTSRGEVITVERFFESTGDNGRYSEAFSIADIEATVKRVAELEKLVGIQGTGEHLVTDREHEVLLHLGHGVSNKCIAAELGIAENTVRFHMNSILTKFRAGSRTEAVVKAIKAGALQLNHIEFK